MSRRRAYAADSTAAVASATKSMLGITGGTTIRPWIYDMWLGSSAAPADNALTWFLQRFTAAGTAGGALVPPPLDPGDPAATSVVGVSQYSAEPTYTAAKILFHLALNQRATHRAQFDPDGPLMIPATSNNGIGLYAVHASFTGNADALVHFAE
jgi:hypothetical protein